MKNWPASNIALRKIAELTPYANNSRTHSAKQIDQIVASINEWGWTMPVLVDEKGMLIAGHGRIMAAQKLGIEEVPTMVAEGWTEAQKKAYIIADNKLALNAGWDEELLGVELQGLREVDFDLDLLGFDGLELDGALDITSIESDKNQHAGETPIGEEDMGKKKMNVFPLLFSLNASQYKKWQELKKATMLSDDELFIAKMVQA